MEKTLGQIILNELERLDYTQTEFARKMNISKSSLNKYIQDNRQIPVDLLVKFAIELNLSLDEIFNLNVSDELNNLSIAEYRLITELRNIESNKRNELIDSFVKILDQFNK